MLGHWPCVKVLENYTNLLYEWEASLPPRPAYPVYSNNFNRLGHILLLATKDNQFDIIKQLLTLASTKINYRETYISENIALNIMYRPNKKTIWCD